MSAILLSNLLGALVINDSDSWEKADSIEQKVSDLAEAIEHSGLNPDVRQEMLKHLFMIESLRDISTPKHGVAEGVASGEPTTQRELDYHLQATRDHMPHLKMQRNMAGEYEFSNTNTGAKICYMYNDPWGPAIDLEEALGSIGYDAHTIVLSQYKENAETLIGYLQEAFGCTTTNRYPWHCLEFNILEAYVANTHSNEKLPIKNGTDQSMLLQINYSLRKLGFEISDVSKVKKPKDFADCLHNLGASVKY